MAIYDFEGRRIIRQTAEAAADAARMAAYAAGIAMSGANQQPGKENDYMLPGEEGRMEKDLLRLRTEGGNPVEIDAMISCNNSKNIVSTAINGMNGTIKEWVSNGDVMISCDMTLVSDDGSYPEEKVREVCSLLEKNESLQVESYILNDIWGVSRVVVTSWNMTPTPTRNYQKISFTMQSDEAYIVMEEIQA